MPCLFWLWGLHHPVPASMATLLLSASTSASLLGTLVMASRAHPDNPGRSLISIASAKMLFPNKVTLTGSRDQDLDVRWYIRFSLSHP